jgi:hypothetical protein
LAVRAAAPVVENSFERWPAIGGQSVDEERKVTKLKRAACQAGGGGLIAAEVTV